MTLVGRTVVAFVVLSSTVVSCTAADWTRFRGPNGSGVSPDNVAPPTVWDESRNLKWKANLPGPGLSSPVVVGDRVIVTCWSGYAVNRDEPGELEQLRRNVVCFDRATGGIIWEHTEEPVLPEDTFRGMFAENGYASHTPVTDGERVYAFFGKTGVVALDLTNGERLWQHSVGERLDGRGWGSASSPIVVENLVIIPAFVEGDALVALDGKTGKEIWKCEAAGYESNWSTPIVVQAGDRKDIVLAVPGEVWGLNPETGGLMWYCVIPGSDSARASVVAQGDLVIAMAGGRGASTSVAVRAGGKGEVKPEWTGRDVSSVGTPVIHEGRMYLVNNKVARSVDLATGERLEQLRLTGTGATGQSDPPSQGRRGPGGQDYSSPIVAGDYLFYSSRSGDTFVVSIDGPMKQVACNAFASDRSDYSSTPAISDGDLFVRSAIAVYCISSAE